MSNYDERIAFYDELSPAEREAFHAKLKQDPEQAEALRRWQEIRTALRRSLQEHVPDRSLLVLYALDRAGRTSLMNPRERVALEAVREDLERALKAHPGLVDVIRHVQEDSGEFEAVWEHHLGAEPSPRRRTSDRPARQTAGWKRWSWRIAAGTAVATFAILLALLIQRDYSMVTIATEEGQKRLIELADGSTVRLMGGSKLTYPDPEEAATFDRRVQLVGRAFFEVTAGQKGFTVVTPTARATVLGTSFGVTARREAADFVLATGRLALAPRQASEKVVVLEPGQKSRVARNALPSTPVAVNLTEALDWTGLFWFHATPVQAIAKQLSAHYEVAVTVASELRGEKVTGTFAQERPLREILSVVAATLGTEVHKDERGRYVIGAPTAQG